MLAPCDGTVNERRFHRIAKRRKRGTYQRDKSSGFGKQALQFREYRVYRVRLEADGGTAGFAQQQPEIDQGLQFAVRGTGTGTGVSGNLSQVKPFIGMSENMPEQSGTGAPEQRIRE